MERPKLNKDISIQDFSEFYWLKKELVSFCKNVGINCNGGKLEISERIKNYITTGNTSYSILKSEKPKSNFDWNSEKLHFQTIITDNYKNTENVRAFFISKIGPTFTFNVRFMNWMKENNGKTLNDAINEWKKIKETKKDKNFKTEIGKQFEYNRYMRAFLLDNPNLSNKDAMKFWKLKRMKRGSNEYHKSDLDLK